MTRVIFDLSRLISRVRHSTPSGVDRVEMAYARGLLARLGADDLAFAAVHPSGLYGRLDRGAALAYLDELERRWAQEEGGRGQRSLVSVLPWMKALLPTRKGVGDWPGALYLQVSPHHLTRQDRIAGLLGRERARFVCLVHDLIPIEYPEYARPSGADLHRQRMASVANLADLVIANSVATGASFARWVERGDPLLEAGVTVPPIHAALLGTEPVAAVEPFRFADARPYFLCLGTIEPRKNHLALLHLWRAMAETMEPAAIPRLVIVGRRGWENEQVLDMLDRCPALAPHVEELSGCPDKRLAALLRGARALLMPSFAEGFGMPVAEALSVGTPVVCSDIAAMREVGGDVPDYRDPLDGPGWLAAILDHAGEGPLHQAQRARVPAWRAPSWDAHMDGVLARLEALSPVCA
ncbi:glycosyltransferase family 4 protein [Novosphingobium sp. 1949]|uniref:Glycosyltransferase family 4 protein n=1 Tax=Novosphingobium organovorum TaxID=2930092 RepID=A0ABT0BIF1_9SPHN|nr:glycosyltransferase family 1 protein [Novosphingobium organovorum]MCJ2184804.1 glycosyltransferase family 4 protein [Novosphingobium organovorum]